MTRLIAALLFTFPLLAAGQEQEKKPEEPRSEAQQQAQPQGSEEQSSLVDLARKTRQERQEVKADQAVLVYTNSSLKQPDRGKVGQMAAPPPPRSEEGQVSGQGEEGAAEEAQTPEEIIDALAEEISTKRAEYVAAVNEFQVLQLSMNDMRDRYLQEADVSTQERFEADLVQTMERLRASEQTIASLKAELTALQAKARSAGMEPARLRRLIGDLPEASRVVQYPPDDSGTYDLDEVRRRSRRRPPN